MEIKDRAKELIDRAGVAQSVIEFYTQEQMRYIARCHGWLCYSRAEVWSNKVFEDTKKGSVERKIARLKDRSMAMLHNINEMKTAGVIEDNQEKAYVKIAKPLGVIVALCPMTIPECVVLQKTMFSLMGRNAIIMTPHPRASRSTNFIANEVRQLFRKLNLPEDLLICVENGSIDLTRELMRQADYVVATGGAPMVKAAYSSGTPTFGVGAGNSVAVVEETADIKDVAERMKMAQLNDLAAGCSTENSIAIQETIYEETKKALENEGGYFLTPQEKELFIGKFWVNGNLNLEIITNPAIEIARYCGFSVPDGTNFLLIEETGYGKDFIASGEKLSPVMTVYKFKDIDDAINLTNGIQAYSGAGHSCGIHSKREEIIEKFALRTKTARLAVNLDTGRHNAGGWNVSMRDTCTVGCGSWGGSVSSDNCTFEHYINTTTVYRELKEKKIPDLVRSFTQEVMDNKELLEGFPD